MGIKTKKIQFSLGKVSPDFIEKFKEAKKKDLMETGNIISHADFIEKMIDKIYPEIEDGRLF